MPRCNNETLPCHSCGQGVERDQALDMDAIQPGPYGDHIVYFHAPCYRAYVDAYGVTETRNNPNNEGVR